MQLETDVVILGAGPVGLFAAFQAGITGFRSHIVDSLPFIGGQCEALYPEKPIYDIPAHPSITARDLIKSLHSQASRFSPTYHLNTSMTSITSSEKGLDCQLSNGDSIKTKFLIIAAGKGIFSYNKPPLKNLADLEAANLVYYNVTDLQLFKNKLVLIAGGGDSAADWALELCKTCKKVFMIHRRSSFRCAESTLKQLIDLEKTGTLVLKTPYQLSSVERLNTTARVTIKNSFDSEKSETLEANAVLMLFGLKTNLGPIEQFGIDISEEKILVSPQNFLTSKDRVYAIGDIATYDGKLGLILVGFSEAAIACNHMYKRENNNARKIEHSSNNDLFAN